MPAVHSQSRYMSPFQNLSPQLGVCKISERERSGENWREKIQNVTGCGK